MKCKHCRLEVHYEGGYLEEEGTGSKQCFANKIKTAGQSFHGHEPAEPEETPAVPQNQIPPAYCEEHDKVHKCELVADHGPRVDTRRFPQVNTWAARNEYAKKVEQSAVEPQKSEDYWISACLHIIHCIGSSCRVCDSINYEIKKKEQANVRPL